MPKWQTPAIVWPTYGEAFEVITKAFATLSQRDYAAWPRAFSRSGVLTQELVTTMLLYMVADNRRRGYTHLMQGFWDDAEAQGIPMPTARPVSGASFCEARQKLSTEALRDILYETAWSTNLAAGREDRRWKGRHVFAVDGTKINLQRHSELEDAFGTPDGAHCPQVLVSVMVDCCARIPMDLEISGYATDERAHLRRMLDVLEPGNVLVLDRGYPSHDLIQALDQSGVDFLIRVPASHTFSILDDFRAAGSTDRVMTLYPPKGAPEGWAAVDVRVLCLVNPDGDESFYVTSLRKPEFSRRDLADLYHMRWESEELFKLLKSDYIGQGQFRSRTEAGVRQEIHGAVLYLAIARFCMQAVNHAEKRDDGTQLSQKGAVLALGTFLLRVLLGPDATTRRAAFGRTLDRIARNRERVRPGRAFKRRSFKPTPKWAPTGRRTGA